MQQHRQGQQLLQGPREFGVRETDLYYVAERLDAKRLDVVRLSLVSRLQFQVVSSVKPCEAAKFILIDYFSTQDFGINIQSSICRDKNLTLRNNQLFFNATILNIKTIKYFSTQIFKYTTGQR